MYKTDMEISGPIGEVVHLDVEVDLILTRASTLPSGVWGRPELYDLGGGPEFEISGIRVIGGTVEKPVIKLFTVREFEAFFPLGERILDNAFEWAMEREEQFHEYD